MDEPKKVREPRARRAVLTKAEWERVEREARRSEREPDVARLSWLPDESAGAPKA